MVLILRKVEPWSHGVGSSQGWVRWTGLLALRLSNDKREFEKKMRNVTKTKRAALKSMVRKVGWIISLAWALGLLAAGCGSGEGETVEGDFYPLAMGNEWKYIRTALTELEMKGTANGQPMNGKVVRTREGTRMEKVVRLDQDTFPVPTVVVEEREQIQWREEAIVTVAGQTHKKTDSGQDDEFSECYYEKAAAGIFERGTQDQGKPLNRYDPPIQLLPIPVKTGLSWTMGDIEKEGLSFCRLRGRALGLENTTVPAGTFSCLKIVFTGDATINEPLIEGSTREEQGSCKKCGWFHCWAFCWG